MTSRKIIVHSSIALAILFSGCATKITEHNAELIETKDLDKAVQEIKTTINTNKEIRFVKPEVFKTKYIDLTVPKRLTVALANLGEIDGRVYYLDKDSKDISLPRLSSSLNYRPNSFDDLRNLLEDLTDYTIEITKNKYNEGRPKVITLKRKNGNFSDSFVDLKSSPNVDVADVLEDIIIKTGFNVSYVQEDKLNGSSTEVPNSDSLEFFRGKRITFYGDNVNDLLNYISESLDLFVEIVPKKKLIVFSKYKQKTFKLTIKNQKIDGSMSVSGSATEGADLGTSTKSSSVDIDLYKEIEETAEKILKGRSESSTDYGYVKVLHNGDVVALGKKSALESIEEVVESYNRDYGRTYGITLTTYDVLLNRENSIGVDLDLIQNDFKIATSNLANKLISYTKTAGTTNPKKVFVDSLNEYGRVVKINNYTYSLTNHIPKYKNKLENRDYFKQTTTTQTGTDSNGTPLYETTPTIEKAKEGIELNLWASSAGDTINLNINAVVTSIISLDEKTLDGKSVTLLRDTTDSFVSDIVLKNGEEVVVDKLSVTEKASDYEGMFPLDDFVIGGKSGGKFVKRFTVVTAKVVENERGAIR